MGIALLDRTAASPVAEPCVSGLLAEAGACLASASCTSVDSLDDSALGQAVTELARLESRAAALRLASRRRQTGDGSPTRLLRPAPRRGSPG
jgi:hypothetical protein